MKPRTTTPAPRTRQRRAQLARMACDAALSVCRACDGDGFIVQDADTRNHERLTRDSKRCPYCSGTGRVAP